MNVVEILIKAVTKDAERNIKKVDKALDSIKKTTKGVGDVFRGLGTTLAIATGILYGVVRAMDAIVERGEKMGQRDLSKQWERLKSQGQEFIDTLLTIKVAGKDAFDLVEIGARLATEFLKGLAVAAEVAALALNVIFISAKRNLGMLQELAGLPTEFTQEWFDAALAAEAFAHQQRVIAIMTEQVTESLLVENQAMRNLQQSYTRTGTKLEDLIRKNKELNNQYSKRKTIEDAIRAGDARALAEAMYGGGGGGKNIVRGGGSGSGTLANGGNGIRGGNLSNGGGGVTVNVSIGNQPIKDITREVIHTEVLGPITKNGGQKGGTKKPPK